MTHCDIDELNLTLLISLAYFWFQPEQVVVLQAMNLQFPMRSQDDVNLVERKIEGAKMQLVSVCICSL